MGSVLRHILPLVLCLIALDHAPVSAQGAAAGTLHVRPVQVMDQTGFDRPVSAFTILVPQHWQARGGVVWGADGPCNQMGYNFDWWATSPDGAQGIGILPTHRWVSSMGQGTTNPCPDLQIASARDLLQQQAAQLMPSAQILDYRPRPDALKALGAPEGGVQRMPMSGGELVMGWDAGEILLAYTVNGQDYRALLGGTVVTWTNRYFPSYGMPGLEMSGGASLPGFAAFAPAGQLDLGTAEALRSSIRPDPEWNRRIAEHHAIINKTNRDGQTEIARINRESNAEISKIINDGYESRMKSMDRNQREFGEYIRGVETYADRNGGTVELDHTYNHAWQLDDGSYVLTNDNFFEPYRDLGLSGARLEPVQ